MQRPDLSSTVQYIAWYARLTPDATAVLDAGSQVNYRRLAADLIRCARALDGLGVGTGMLVGVEMPLRYQHLVLLLACEMIGAATASLAPDELSPDGVISRHCDVILAGTTQPDADLEDGSLARMRPSGSGLPRMITIPPDWLAGMAASAAGEEDVSVLERQIPSDQVVRIVKTSGTTGHPKMMPMSGATQQLRIIRTMDRVAHDILPHPRFLCIYKLAVGGIYVRALGILQHGGTVLFSVEEYACALIAAGAVNYAIFAVGDTERIINDAVPAPPGHVFRLEVFGAAVSAGLRQKIRDRLNAVVSNTYSSNETNPIALVDDDNVGTLFPGVEVRIVDEAGRSQPEGIVGQIWVRSETMVHSYFADPALTAATFVDGWYRTSDIGHVPAPGKLIVVGRTDDLLNIGGIKIARLRLEAQLRLIDGVDDAVAVSVANQSGVGLLRVAIETEHLSDDLLRQVDAVVSHQVRVFEIVPLRWFPRTDSGKAKRAEIERLMREREAAGWRSSEALC